MKKGLLLFAIALVQLVANAQPRTNRWEVKTPGLWCEECEAIIESRMQRVDGVMEIDAKWRAKKVVIKFIPDRVDTANLKVFIAQIGFDAGDEKAEASQLKLLPVCCQAPPVKKGAVATQPVPAPTPTPTQAPVKSKPTPNVGQGGAKPATPATAAKPSAGAKPATPATPAKPSTNAKPAKPTTLQVAKPKPKTVGGKK